MTEIETAQDRLILTFEGNSELSKAWRYIGEYEAALPIGEKLEDLERKINSARSIFNKYSETDEGKVGLGLIAEITGRWSEREDNYGAVQAGFSAISPRTFDEGMYRFGLQEVMKDVDGMLGTLEDCSELAKKPEEIEMVISGYESIMPQSGYRKELTQLFRELESMVGASPAIHLRMAQFNARLERYGVAREELDLGLNLVEDKDSQMYKRLKEYGERHISPFLDK